MGASRPGSGLSGRGSGDGGRRSEGDDGGSGTRCLCGGGNDGIRSSTAAGGNPVPGSALAGTVSAVAVTSLLGAVGFTGGDVAALSRVPGLDPALLPDDESRIATVLATKAWEELLAVQGGPSAVAAVVEALPLGAMGLWDHLFAAGPTPAAGLRDALRYWSIFGDPSDTAFEIVDDGALITVRHHATDPNPEVTALRAQYTLGLLADRVTEVCGDVAAPVRVSFAQRAPRRHAELTRMLGTGNLEFEAAEDSITFLAADLGRPVPGHRPGLSDLLCDYAAQKLRSARPVFGWLDLFRAHLESGLAHGTPALPDVARALASSPRTVQRRLGEHGTSWRTEVDDLRAAQASRLLRDTDLSMRSIAVRLGYSDDRVLRRAMQRWEDGTDGPGRTDCPDHPHRTGRDDRTGHPDRGDHRDRPAPRGRPLRLAALAEPAPVSTA